MPQIELPAGTTVAAATDDDRRLWLAIRDWGFERALREARLCLRAGRREQRRALGRPAAKRARAVRELGEARSHLRTAGVLCGVANLLGSGLTVLPEQIARVRERCDEQLAAEPGAFAVTVENWIRDLAGEDRLARG